MGSSPHLSHRRSELNRVSVSLNLEHLNTYDDHVNIVDNLRNRIVSVYFKVDGGPWCDLDDSDSCTHIEYIWTIPEIAETLRKHGLKSPDEERALERIRKMTRPDT